MLNLLIPLILLLASVGIAAAYTGNERVLVLNSYHNGYTWSDNETAGILDSLAAAGIKTDPLIEYLDTKHHPKQEHFPQLMELLKVKKELSRPDIVLTLDDPAFFFAINYRKKLFANIPIVFIGLNDFHPSMLKGEENVTGAMERQDFRGTVEIALTLQPRTREVVVVHDYTPSGLATHRDVMEQLAPLSDRISVRSLPEMTFDGIIDSLSKLGSGSIVLAVSYSVDKAGRIFNHSELAKELSEKSPVPVYSTKVERLGHGIVGGSLMDGRAHGSQGADLALAVLKQGTAVGVPVIEHPRSELMFDYRQLVRFNIPLRNLPPGSKVINRPQSFYSQHSQVINVSALIIEVLFASLIIVIIVNQRRMKAEAELYESRSYQVLFENASDPIFVVNSHGIILESSRVAQNLLQLNEGALKNRVLTAFVCEADARDLQSYLMQVQLEGKGIFNTSFILANGDVVPVELNSRTTTYRGETVIFCSARDMTEQRRANEKLSESENRYQIFTSITSDYVYKCTRKGNEPYRIKWLAGAVEKITGYSKEEIIQMACWIKLIHPDDKDRVGTFLLGLVPGDRAAIEFRIITKSGDVRWIKESSYCEPGADPGELIHYGSSQDITSRKLVEDEIQHLNSDFSKRLNS